MGFKLTAADERSHPLGTASNWNESRYVDFWDAKQRVGGWFRIGNRPNEGHGEVSACVYLPDGSLAFWFERAKITAKHAAKRRAVVGDHRALARNTCAISRRDADADRPVVA